MPECNLRPLNSIRHISQWNQDKGQEQKEHENIVQGMRRAAGKEPWNFATLNGKAGKNPDNVETAPGHDTPNHPNHHDRAWSDKKCVRQSTEKLF